jgi:hypothetical protein
MTQVYLKCVRIGGADWESSEEGSGVVARLDGDHAVVVSVGDVVVVEDPELISWLAGIPPEKQQAVLDYDGPEDFGHPEWKNKR